MLVLSTYHSNQFQRIMCGAKSVWCRICLSPNILPPYLQLTEDDTGQVELLSALLDLDLSLLPPHLPRQVCAICLGTVQSFNKLKEVARVNDDLLHHNQDQIR